MTNDDEEKEIPPKILFRKGVSPLLFYNNKLDMRREKRYRELPAEKQLAFDKSLIDDMNEVTEKLDEMSHIHDAKLAKVTFRINN